MADDRPLRRAAAQPAHRRLCARPCLSARRSHPRRHAAAGNPGAGHRRSAGRHGRGGRACTGRQTFASGCAPARSVTTDDRNWELRYSHSALRFSLSRAVGIDMESATIAGSGLSLPRALWDLALRLGQADPRRTQAPRAGQPLLRGGHCRHLAHWSRDLRATACSKATDCTAASCAPSTSRLSAKRKSTSGSPRSERPQGTEMCRAGCGSAHRPAADLPARITSTSKARCAGDQQNERQCLPAHPGTNRRAVWRRPIPALRGRAAFR